MTKTTGNLDDRKARRTPPPQSPGHTPPTGRFRLLPWLSLATIGVAALALAGGYATSAWWPVAPAIVLLGALWALWQHQGWAGDPAFALVLAVLAAAAGFLSGVEAGWLLVGVVAALAAWDLGQFAQRLRQAGRVQGREELERRHLQRLALASALGLLLGIAALLVQVRFSFLIALLLAAVLTVGTGELVLYLRRGSRE